MEKKKTFEKVYDVENKLNCVLERLLSEKRTLVSYYLSLKNSPLPGSTDKKVLKNKKVLLDNLKKEYNALKEEMFNIAQDHYSVEDCDEELVNIIFEIEIEENQMGII